MNQAVDAGRKINERDKNKGPRLSGDRIDWIPERPRTYRIAKRLLDVVMSATALVLFSPLFVAIPLLIKLTIKGPILFKQTRIGHRGKPFTFLKFRTMYTDIDARDRQAYIRSLIAAGDQAAGAYRFCADPRLTPVGRFLRRTSLDELPQFLNVLRGDMSLIGPRPPLPYEMDAYEPWHKLRLSCKPGVTGLWQVKGRSKVTFDDMVRLDIEYCRNSSMRLDLRILLETPVAVFFGH